LILHAGQNRWGSTCEQCDMLSHPPNCVLLRGWLFHTQGHVAEKLGILGLRRDRRRSLLEGQRRRHADPTSVGHFDLERVGSRPDFTASMILHFPGDVVRFVLGQGRTRHGIGLVSPRAFLPAGKPFRAEIAPYLQGSDKRSTFRCDPNGADVLGTEASADRQGAYVESKRLQVALLCAKDNGGRGVLPAIVLRCGPGEIFNRKRKRIDEGRRIGIEVGLQTSGEKERAKHGPSQGAKVATLFWAMGIASCGVHAKTTEASSSLYVRSDTNKTTVVSPRVRAAALIDDTLALDVSETVDAWTGASVDIVTAATGTVREKRYETNGGLAYLGQDWSLGGAYRYSTEPDYWSHGGLLRLSLDLAAKNTTVTATVFGSSDTVGRAGDPGIRRAQGNGGGRISLSQVLSRNTTGELQWETSYIDGYQASPYRSVAIGGQGICAQGAPYCLAEKLPTQRLRHAPSFLLRRAIGRRMSFGLGYRLYFDSWGLWSHTAEPDLAFLVGRHGLFSVYYRYYTQGDADFYRPRYFSADSVGYLTRDRKLSAFYTQGAGVSYTHTLVLGKGGTSLDLGLRASVSHFRYLAFVGLQTVSVLESTGMLVLRFD
jgi:Protein of unknown function (DUF3570)